MKEKHRENERRQRREAVFLIRMDHRTAHEERSDNFPFFPHNTSIPEGEGC